MSNKQSLRLAYGEFLKEEGAKNQDLLVFDADLSGSTCTALFQEKYPERHFNMGIAESNLCLSAAGAARLNKTVFASSFAMFLTGRGWEFIRNSIAYDKVNVKLVATHAGISVGEDGGSHQANEDIAIMRAIPNLQVFCPADYYETKAILSYAVAKKGPMYIRLSREVAFDVFDNSYQFNPFLPVCINNSPEAKGVVFTTGLMTGIVKQALSLLKNESIVFSHYHISTLKPLSSEAVGDIVKNYSFGISFEEHSIIGGLGDTVLGCMATQPIPFYKEGIQDTFTKSGKSEELFNVYGLSIESVKTKLTKYFSL